MRRVTHEMVDEWAKLQPTMTLTEIAKRYGCSMASVHNHLKKRGIKRGTKVWRSKTRESLFFEKVFPEPNSGCWLWTAGYTEFGYGLFKHLCEYVAHRVSYRMHIGDIPDGLQVLHRCDVPECVNPQHLFLGTQKQNMDDMTAKGRAKPHKLKNTHCPSGHPYEGDNLYRTPEGGRGCRTCRRAHVAKYEKKKRETEREQRAG